MRLEQAWYEKRWWCWLLLPLSLLYWFLDRLNYRLNRSQAKLSPPVLIVGNIVAGGSGKSMLVAWLVKHLEQQGKKVGVISRGYGAQIGEIREVLVDDDAMQVGDEPLMLKQQLACPVVVGRERLAAYEFVTRQYPLDIVISDDGLQHYKLPRNGEIILVDGQRQFGNGLLLPAGPLRERTSRLNSADLVLAKGQACSYSDDFFKLKVADKAARQLQSLDKTKCYAALCGIANPASFTNTLAEFNIDFEMHHFGDHHQFCRQDIEEFIGQPLLVTRKDAVKLTEFSELELIIVDVELEFTDTTFKKITTLLDRLMHD